MEILILLHLPFQAYRHKQCNKILFNIPGIKSFVGSFRSTSVLSNQMHSQNSQLDFSSRFLSARLLICMLLVSSAGLSGGTLQWEYW